MHHTREYYELKQKFKQYLFKKYPIFRDYTLPTKEILSEVLMQEGLQDENIHRDYRDMIKVVIKEHLTSEPFINKLKDMNSFDICFNLSYKPKRVDYKYKKILKNKVSRHMFKK